jgi:glyoxylase-like metal-dependent hydrolase (beta-lactamase superfamily II)
MPGMMALGASGGPAPGARDRKADRMEARVERVEAAGRNDRNAWVIGDGDEVVVIDPGEDAGAVLAAVGDREILAVICTHGHEAHVAAAPELASRDDAPVALHPKDLLPWREAHGDEDPDIEMEEGGSFEVAGVTLEVLHTPGHTPGSVSIYCDDLGVVFSGDALAADGPVPHAGEFPDFAAQLSAIGSELLTLPGGTRVLSGHGEETTIAAAEKQFDGWVTAGPVMGDAEY